VAGSRDRKERGVFQLPSKTRYLQDRGALRLSKDLPVANGIETVAPVLRHALRSARIASKPLGAGPEGGRLPTIIHRASDKLNSRKLTCRILHKTLLCPGPNGLDRSGRPYPPTLHLVCAHKYAVFALYPA
jgi:hypothetical protein